ncbi:TonB-dependent receptor family protein [Ekhidna sp.]
MQDTVYYPNYQLKEVTVSAPRLPPNSAELPMSITVLDSLLINVSNQNLSIKEYLQQVPGVYIQNAYNFAQDARISIRGFGATAAFGVRGIKLIVDGIPETTPDGTGQLDNLNLDLIKRIEVIRGTAGSLYGNASGGAIIVKSDFDFDQNFLRSNSLFGSYGFYSQSITGGITKGSTVYMSHLRIFGSDGYRNNSQFKQINGRFAVKHKVSDKVSAVMLAEFVNSPKAQDAGGLTLEEAEADTRQARDRNLTFNAGESITQWKTGASVNWKWSSNKELNSYAFFNRRTFDGKLPFENSGIIELKRNYFGVGNNLDLKLKNHSLKIGYDLLSQQDERSRFNNLEGQKGDLALDQKESFLNFGVYMLDYLELDQWYFSAGLRHDFNRLKADDFFQSNGDDSGEIDINNWSYHFGVGRVLSSSLQLFANYSNNFETPTLNQLSNRPDNSGGFESLEAATASTIESGLKWRRNKIKGEFITFITQTENELIPYELEEFPERTFFRNAGSTIRKGIEFSMNYSSNLWRVNATYTLSDFTYQSFDSNGTDLEGFTLPGIPKNNITLSLTSTPAESLEITVPLGYVGRIQADNQNEVTIEDYLEVSFSIRYKTSINGLRIEPYFGIRNLTNQTYFDNVRINAFGGRYYEPAPERNFYAGLIIKLVN